MWATKTLFPVGTLRIRTESHPADLHMDPSVAPQQLQAIGAVILEKIGAPSASGIRGVQQDLATILSPGLLTALCEGDDRTASVQVIPNTKGT